MADRRPHNNTYSSRQWNGGHQHAVSANGYPSTSYPSTSDRNHASAQHMLPTYGAPHGDSTSYQGDHYASNATFSQSGSPSLPPHSIYGSPHRSSYSHTYSPPSSRGQPYSQAQPLSQPHYSQPRPQAQVYPPQTAPMMIPPHSSSHHAAQVPFSSGMSISPQYPASPTRPFSCDLCALSFNRQHDLKRHRETHTGEKPYLCNGGCGKTFTRKDALKRHQLVKGCGKVDEAWP